MISVGTPSISAQSFEQCASKRQHVPPVSQSCKQAGHTCLRVGLLTPWNQQCGNAEFAKRLTSGFTSFATVEPIELENLIEHDTLDSRRKQEGYITKLIKQVRASDADLIHIQHEFCFFGKTRRYADRRLLRLMRNIRKPIVLSLHTWKNSMCKKGMKLSLKSVLSAACYKIQNRWMRRCLFAADAIVVHSKDT
ncbi:MAG: hypothetical protein HOD99_00210, partial [Planctomycetaceae bacterium]|nr:hypothetical protein [Planctomycetaceae bacterium]